MDPIEGNFCSLLFWYLLIANCRLYWRWNWMSCWWMFKRFLLKLWIRLKEIFALYYSDTFCLRIADFTEDETEWAVDKRSRDFLYIESFLTLFPDNSCEDLQCCFYFPMTPFLYLLKLWFNWSNFIKSNEVSGAWRFARLNLWSHR